MILVDYIYILYAFGFGLIVGSFMNAAEYRLVNKLPLFLEKSGEGARSMCPQCGEQLLQRDLVPVVSYLNLRGQCRSCKKKISWQYPAVELVAGFMFMIPALVFGWGAEAVFYALFGAVLLFIFIYDLKHQMILDVVTLPAMGLALVAAVVLQLDPLELLIGVVIGGGFFALQYFVSRGRWVGGGDIRLGILMGLMLGWQKLLVALFLAYVSGAFTGLLLLGTKKAKLKSRLPFGVFLTVATFICLLYGDQIIQWYLGLLV
ncbi:prepilin peptidase [Patescibacteria group bacterium]